MEGVDDLLTDVELVLSDYLAGKKGWEQAHGVALDLVLRNSGYLDAGGVVRNCFW